MPLLTTGAGAYVSAAVAPSGYQGPVDVIPGALGFWGLRAASAATRGTNAVRLIRSSDSAEANIITDATTGELNIADAFFNGSTYKVVTLYNQLGSGPPGHMAPLTVPGGRPTFTRTGWDGKPTIEFSSTTELAVPSAGASTYNHPVLLSGAVFRPMKAGAAVATRYIMDYNIVQIASGSSHNAAGTSAATGTSSVIIGDNALHVLSAMYNSAASGFRIDGQVASTWDSGTTSPFLYYGPIFNFSAVGGQNMTAMECCFWQGSDHSASLAALQANMTAFWITGTRAQWDALGYGGTYTINDFLLSNDGRTATAQAAGFTGVGSSIYHLHRSLGYTTSSQKVYIEHVVTTDAGTTGWAFGFCTGAAVVSPGNVWATETPSISAVINNSGTFLCEDSANHNTATIASWGVGDRIGIAFNTATGKMWFRKNNGSWNSVIGGSQDPAGGGGGAGTGGVTVPFAGPYHAMFGLYEPLVGDAITTNFATATWVDSGSVPSGYTQLTRTL